MKKKLLVLALCLMSIQITQVLAQESPGFPFTGWAYGDDGMPCENSPVQLVVRFIDLLEGDNEVYKESFSTMSNERGQFTVDVSKGDVESGEFNSDFLTKPRYKMVIDMIVDCDGEEVVIVDRDVAAPRVPIAEDAENWGGMPAPDMKSDTIGWKEIFASLGLRDWGMPVFGTDSMGNDSTKLMTPADLRAQITQKDLCDYTLLEPMTPEEIQDKVDSNTGVKEVIVDLFGNTFIVGNTSLIPVEYYDGTLRQKYRVVTIPPSEPGQIAWSHFKTCDPIEDPYSVFGNGSVKEAPRSKFTMNVPEIGSLGHGLEVSVHGDSVSAHNTAAIWGNNPHGTTGILGAGGNFGSFAQGATGNFGVTLNDGISGSGNWGTIGHQPDKGLFAYGVLADANNFLSSAQAWAIAIFGDGFHTGNFLQLSDARVKHSMRAPNHVLDRIMALEPSKYQYNQNTSLNLPEGEHYGFIAQEVEEVFPELVSEVVVPSVLDEESISTSAIEEYMAINYTALIPILTKAIQELNSKVDDQNAEIKRLGAIIEDLKND